MMRIHHTLGLTTLLALAGPAAAAAQTADACPEGQITFGTIGIAELSCRNCRIARILRADEGLGTQYWGFRSEPTIGRVRAGSPAAGKLRAGDVITAVDGHLITTREGGMRYGSLVPGTPVTLGVRRGSRDLDVTVTPVGECRRFEDTPPAPPPAPARPAPVPRADAPPPRLPAPPAPRPGPSMSALGFSIRCSNCSIQRSADANRWVWSFSAAPVVEAVEPNSPAHEAGLRAGDVLTGLDGQPLVTAAGGERFGAVAAGDRITLTYQRGSREGTATLVAREALDWQAEVVPAPAAPVLPAEPDVQRFSGSLGDAVIQVTGGRITVTRTDDEIVIRSSDITVRITRAGGR
jgi:membrane-associated protease RseP (regulator of RpoE activity)